MLISLRSFPELNIYPGTHSRVFAEAVWKEKTMKRKIFTAVTLLCFTIAVTPVALATNYEVELVVQSGKKSKETDAVLALEEEAFSVTPDKDKYQQHAKTFRYEEIKVADYSYAKKPLLSVGGAVATAILLGLFVLPLLFLKKKKHWLTVQGTEKFAVIKMNKGNYRSIIAELETKGITVNEVTEEDDKKRRKREKEEREKAEEAAKGAKADDSAGDN